MNHSITSCAVAHPTQRNCATQELSATSHATNLHTTTRKPASIQELRAQLKTQQGRNQALTTTSPSGDEVAGFGKNCVVALPRERNNATQQLVSEFMEVDGMTLEEAQAWAAQSIPVRPAAEWIAMIQELDHLIERYCSVHGVSSGAQAEMRAARNKQSIATIPETLEWFKNALTERRDGKIEK